jgi:glycerol-3-phosphate O-acyltransferase
MMLPTLTDMLAGWAEATTVGTTIPLWALVTMSVLSAVALLDRLLIPLVRGVMRRRVKKTIDDLNTKLQLRIQPFKLTRRKALIDQLRNDPDVLTAIDVFAKEKGISREAAAKKAKAYAHEIVPSFSAYAYFRIGARLSRRISEALYRVRIGYTNDVALKAVDPNASVVFVINHRSNMDYVLVTYLASQAAALSYAVGEWAQIWPLSHLIRSMGAYFIRRNSRDQLYRRIVARYVAMATNAGVVQAVFPEGGLSRDGLLKPPKLGLLAYMVQSFDPNSARDIVFIPVGINYDRVLEDRNLTAAAALAPGQEPSFKFNPMVFIRYFGGVMARALTGRLYRNGYACVSFGEPVSLKNYLAPRAGARPLDFRTLDDSERQQAIQHLGQHLMDQVGRVIPALPVSLVATAILQAGAGPLSEFELKGRIYSLISQLESGGSYVHIPRHDFGYAIDVGLRMLTMRHLILVEDGAYTANPKETAILRYYANAIAHLLRTKEQVAA